MIARIIMSEHPNEKDLEHFSSDHKEAVKDGFLANTQFSISVQTSPTSLLVISGYEDQKSADSNLEARQKWFDERKGKYLDTFYYEGEIKTQMKGGGKQIIKSTGKTDPKTGKSLQFYCRLGTSDEKVLDEIFTKGCLLYTSPSPRDRTRSRMPSSA